MKSLAASLAHLKCRVKDCKSEGQRLNSPFSTRVLKTSSALLAVLYAALPATIVDQNLAGGISGTVRESAGGAVANAIATVENTDRHLVALKISSYELGDFMVRLLTIGQEDHNGNSMRLSDLDSCEFVNPFQSENEQPSALVLRRKK